MKVGIASMGLLSPAGRGGRVLLSGASGLIMRGISILSTFVTVPLALGVLGQERYGLLVTITSSLSLLGLADLGVGNGLISLVAAARGAEDQHRVRSLISSGWIVSWGTAVVVVSGFALAGVFISWPGLLNAHSSVGVSEAAPAVFMAVALLAIGMPVGIAQRICNAYQEAFVSNAWSAVGSLAAIALTWSCASAGLGLPAFVFAALGGGVLAQTVASCVEYGFRKPEVRPSLAWISTRHTKELLGQGVLFLAMQVTVIAASSADNIIIVRTLGPQDVTSYSVTGRLFIVGPLLLSTFFAPLWPAYADALARGDSGWIRSTLKKTVLVAAITSVGLGGIAILLGPWFLTKWVGSTVGATTPLMLGLAAWSVTTSIAGALSMLLNGLQVVRFQAVVSAITAAATIAAKTWVVSRWGIAAIPWAQVVVHGVLALIPSAIVVRRLLRRL